MKLTYPDWMTALDRAIIHAAETAVITTLELPYPRTDVRPWLAIKFDGRLRVIAPASAADARQFAVDIMTRVAEVIRESFAQPPEETRRKAIVDLLGQVVVWTRNLQAEPRPDLASRREDVCAVLEREPWWPQRAGARTPESDVSATVTTPVDPVDTPYFTRDEAAERLGMSSSKLDRMIKAGKIHVNRIGRSVRIPLTEIKRLRELL